MELYKNREWFYQKYIIERLPRIQIAKKAGCHEATIRRWLPKHGITPRTQSEAGKLSLYHRPQELYQKRAWLYQRYIVEEQFPYQIAGKSGCSEGTILNWLRRHGIEIRSKSEAQKIINRNPEVGKRKSKALKISQNRPEVKKKHSEAMKIIMNCPDRRKKISELAIKRTKVKDDSYRDKSWLQGMHNDEKLCPNEIAKICGVCGRIIRRWMKKLGVETRTISAGAKIAWAKPENKKKISGANSSSWLGGISFEPYGLEFNNELKLFIRKRDGYRCQECKIKETLKAHASHHIDYNKKNNIPENLILLCVSCHPKTGINREYWQNHFMFSMQLRIND